MSTIEQPLTSTTWRVDAVHSTVGFAVKHMIVSTFRGSFETYDATLIELDGELAIHGCGRRRRASSSRTRTWPPTCSRRSSSTPSSTRRSASSSTDIARRRRRQRRRRRRADDQGPHAAASRPRGSISRPLEDPFGGVTTSASSSRPIIDRTRVRPGAGTLPLPKGGLALDNDVKLIVNLEFTQA